MRTLAGWIVAATALLACPCHLPFTLPLLLALVGGTAVGSVILTNPDLVIVLATAYFFLGGVLALWLLSGRRAPADPTPPVS
ncbi:MAG: hypothetical protein K6U89_16220 [Chloroflexi bacterium]|nr:hypothetical protein [Chloroflexota bacterium]